MNCPCNDRIEKRKGDPEVWQNTVNYPTSIPNVCSKISKSGQMRDGGTLH